MTLIKFTSCQRFSRKYLILKLFGKKNQEIELKNQNMTLKIVVKIFLKIDFKNQYIKCKNELHSLIILKLMKNFNII